MKKQVSILLIFTFVISFFSLDLMAQTDRDWWNSLSPGWKKVFQNQELKGKDVEPNDEQLTRIVRVTHINCSHNKDIENLKPLSKLTLLEEIRCNDTQIKSLEGIENLTNLKILDCSNNDNISSVAPLRNIVSLEELSCGNTMVKDLSPLKGLVNLKKLDVHFATVNKLLVIGELINLEILDVSENQSLFDIDGIEGLVNLREFNISDTHVDNIKPIKMLKKLEIINISKTPVVTLRPIQQHKMVRELDCSDTYITASSLDYLYAYYALEMLRARNIDATEEEIQEFKDYFSKKNPDCTVLITPRN